MRKIMIFIIASLVYEQAYAYFKVEVEANQEEQKSEVKVDDSLKQDEVIQPQTELDAETNSYEYHENEPLTTEQKIEMQKRYHEQYDSVERNTSDDNTGDDADLESVDIKPIESLTFEISKGMTLRENLTEWCRQAGWEDPVWDTNIDYQLTTGAFLEMDFEHAVDTLLELVNTNNELDWHGYRSNKILRIWESSK